MPVSGGNIMQLTTELSRTPKPTLILRFVSLEIGSLARRVARALGINRPRLITPEDLAVPDSELARQATTFARLCEPDFLFNHSMRSYFFAIAVGKHLDLARTANCSTWRRYSTTSRWCLTTTAPAPSRSTAPARHVIS